MMEHDRDKLYEYIADAQPDRCDECGDVIATTETPNWVFDYHGVCEGHDGET